MRSVAEYKTRDGEWLPLPPNWREKYRVRIAFVFALLFVWRVQPRYLVLLLAGLLISLAGLALRQWAAGCVKKMDELAVTGPYALVRHPLYAGSFLIAFGLVLGASSFSPRMFSPYLDRTLFYWCFLWILMDSIYFPKVLKEEEELSKKFPGAYQEYSQKVPRFIPIDIHFSQLDLKDFKRELWLKNKEYYALAGTLLLWILLFFRYKYNR